MVYVNRTMFRSCKKQTCNTSLKTIFEIMNQFRQFLKAISLQIGENENEKYDFELYKKNFLTNFENLINYNPLFLKEN